MARVHGIGTAGREVRPPRRLGVTPQNTRKHCAWSCFRVKCRVVDLPALLKQNEGKTLEFKRDLSSSDRVLKCLVAFANTAGGTLVIGIEDGTKHVRGLPDVLGTEEKLANLIADSIRPRLVPEIEIVP